MRIGELPSAEALHRIYDEAEKHFSVKENRDERNYKFLGITLTSSLGPQVVFGLGRCRYVTIPKNPNFFQKAVAFLLVQMTFFEFARREDDFIDYAFSWLNAREIFRW